MDGRWRVQPACSLWLRPWLLGVINLPPVDIMAAAAADAAPPEELWGILSIYNRICRSQALAPQRDALAAEHQLGRSLLQALLPVFAAAAEAVQLPAEQRNAAFSWPSLALLADVLACSGTINSALLELLPDASSQAAVALQAAVQLARLAPAAAAPDFAPSQAARLFAQLTQLLSQAAPAVLSSGSALQQHRAAEQLVAALPGLQAWARLLACEPGLAASAADCCTSWDKLGTDLASWSQRCTVPGGLASEELCRMVQSWCHAGTAALRCMPYLSQLLQAVQLGAEGWRSNLNSLCGRLVQLVQSCTCRARSLLCPLEGEAGAAPSEQQLAACLPAVHLLHTTLCRAVHWVLGHPGAGAVSWGFVPLLCLLLLNLKAAFDMIFQPDTGEETYW